MCNDFIFVLIDYLYRIVEEEYKLTKKPSYNVLNEIIMNLLHNYKKEDFESMLMLCKDGMQLVKFIDGNHYRIWLFYKLEELIQEKIK